MEDFFKKIQPYFPIFLILVIASFLRLYRIADYMMFLGDEGRDVLVVKRMIVDHKFTLLGPTASVGGFFLGPIYYYFMIPFLWAFRLEPVGPAVMVALIGVVTVFLVYWTGKDFFDWGVGLIAAAFYAVSPLVINYSRSSWNPNVMPTFALLTIYASWWAVKKKSILLFFLVGFLFGLAFQIHYLATFLLVAVGVYLLIFVPWRRNFKNYGATLVGFLAGWSPFLLFELRHQFPNFRSLYKFIFFGEETGFVAGKFLPTVANVGFRLFERLVAGNNQILALVLILMVVTFFFRDWLKNKKDKTLALLGIWFLVGVFLFGFYQKPIYDYYFGFMFPLPFLLTAYGLRKLRQVAWLLCGLLLIVNYQGLYFHKPPNRQLEQTKTIARLIIEKTENQPFNFALITGQNSDHAYRYFLEIWGAKPVTVENPHVDPERKTVTDQLLVVCEVADCHPLGYHSWEVAGFGRAEIEGIWEAPGGIKIMKLIHYQGNE